jgi:hypothetical protein
MLVYLSAQGFGGIRFNKSGYFNDGVNFIEDARIILCGSVLNIFYIINQHRRIFGMNRKGTKIFSSLTSHGNNLENEISFPHC